MEYDKLKYFETTSFAKLFKSFPFVIYSLFMAALDFYSIKLTVFHKLYFTLSSFLTSQSLNSSSPLKAFIKASVSTAKLVS